MSPNLGPAGLRGARFKALFARSSYVGIGWDLWGFLPHFLPQKGKNGRWGVTRLYKTQAFAACLPRPICSGS